MTPNLEVSDVTVRFGGITAVEGVSFTMGAGALSALIGPNGAGKTTLIDALSGFVRYDGSVSVRGRPVDGLRPDQRAELGLRRTFQSLDLFEDLTVRENVAIGASDAATVDQALTSSGLFALADRLPSSVPVGARRLVALLRACVAGPSVLLLDEVAAGLDPGERIRVAELLRRITSAGTSVLLVDHDLDFVTELAERIIVLDAGRVLANGPSAIVRRDERVRDAYLRGQR